MVDLYPNPQKPWWTDSLVFFSRISGWIVGPVLVAFIAGEIVSDKWPMLSWLTFLFIGLAFAGSCIGIARETFAHLRKLKQDEGENSGKDSH